MNIRNDNFHQSALIVSLTVTVSLAASYLLPSPEWDFIPGRNFLYDFGKWLGIFWLAWAIFRNVIICAVLLLSWLTAGYFNGDPLRSFPRQS